METNREHQEEPFIRWFGYRHINGTLHVKRFFQESDLKEALESDFVAHVVLPFCADTRNQAVAILKERIRRLKWLTQTL